MAPSKGSNGKERVAKLYLPRLKTAATMATDLVISAVVAAVFNRGRLDYSLLTGLCREYKLYLL